MTESARPARRYSSGPRCGCGLSSSTKLAMPPAYSKLASLAGPRLAVRTIRSPVQERELRSRWTSVSHENTVFEKISGPVETIFVPVRQWVPIFLDGPRAGRPVELLVRDAPSRWISIRRISRARLTTRDADAVQTRRDLTTRGRTCRRRAAPHHDLAATCVPPPCDARPGFRGRRPGSSADHRSAGRLDDVPVTRRCSSTELSTTSYTMWCRPSRCATSPMYNARTLAHGVEALEDLDASAP